MNVVEYEEGKIVKQREQSVELPGSNRLLVYICVAYLLGQNLPMLDKMLMFRLLLSVR